MGKVKERSEIEHDKQMENFKEECKKIEDVKKRLEEIQMKGGKLNPFLKIQQLTEQLRETAAKNLEARDNSDVNAAGTGTIQDNYIN